MTQGDMHMMKRGGVGVPYKIEDDQRVYVKRHAPRARPKAERVEVTVFPAAGGLILARGKGATEAEARANVTYYEREAR